MADDDGNVVSFRPRSASVPPPPLPGDTVSPVESGPAASAAVDAPPSAGVPALPRVENAMRPPAALLLPPPPPLGGGSGGGGGSTGDDGDDPADDSALAPPTPADLDAPTGRELLQICMAIVTAMGVAAAQAVWQRARQRRALADKARAGRSGSRALTASHHESGGGLRRRSRSSGHSGSSLGMLGSSGSGGRSRSRAGRSSSRHGRGHGEPFDFDGRRRPPKASKKGHPDWPDLGKLAGRLGRLQKSSARKAAKAAKKALAGRPGAARLKPSSAKPEKTKTAPKVTRKTSVPKQAAARRLRWKAPRKNQQSRPGAGGERALPPGRKRWTSRPGVGTPGVATKVRRRATRTRLRGRWRRWQATQEWLRGRRRWRTWRAKSARAADAKRAAAQAGEQWQERPFTPPPPPPPRASWMRPPPGCDRRVWVEESERVDPPRWRPEPRQPTAVRGAPASGWLQLPPAPAEPKRKPKPRPNPPAPGGPVIPRPLVPSSGIQSTQYGDADLTVYDVIDADQDMAEQITAGVEEARRTADGCARLLSRLEALHAEIVDLKVPGVLEQMFVRLMDQTLTVKARAESIAETLPAAAEAISIAGSNAEARHRQLADAVRDAGHIRPAEREYHEE